MIALSLPWSERNRVHPLARCVRPVVGQSSRKVVIGDIIRERPRGRPEKQWNADTPLSKCPARAALRRLVLECVTVCEVRSQFDCRLPTMLETFGSWRR